MRLRIVVILAALLVIAGVGSVHAEGSSNKKGDGYHCYLFFDMGDEEFTQVVINDSEKAGLEKEIIKAIDKYVFDKGGSLMTTIGNYEALYVRGDIEIPVCGEMNLVECPCWTNAQVDNDIEYMRSLVDDGWNVFSASNQSFNQIRVENPWADEGEFHGAIEYKFSYFSTYHCKYFRDIRRKEEVIEHWYFEITEPSVEQIKKCTGDIAKIRSYLVE